MKIVLLAACMLLELAGIVLFLRGFFPVKTTVKGTASWNNISIEPSVLPNTSADNPASFPATFGRVVFVLIDALRADFALPVRDADLPYMPFVREKIMNGETKSFMARAHPPTVTMPRIKALMTGGIPGFVDVVLNFDSSALQEDSLIEQLHLADRSMVFYGDDTWIRLFPDKFLRQEGTTSFFVTDYTEVDNNVTRHISSELSRSDWDVLILHYLGLDHIGHLAGPRSPLIAPKLQEMDDIVKSIYATLIKQDREGADGLPSLLVLCGDHGMSEQGSHGGSSYSEVATPLVMMSSLWENNAKHELGDKMLGIPEVMQTDVSPSLCLLLGLPVPQNSVGVYIPALFSSLSPRQQLQAAHANAQQMSRVLEQSLGAEEWLNAPESQLFSRAVSAHHDFLHDGALPVDKVISLYQRAMTAARDRVARANTQYDMHAMITAICILGAVLVCLLLLPHVPHIPRLSWPLFLAILGALLFLQLAVCTGGEASPTLCHHPLILTLLCAVVAVIVQVIILTVIVTGNCSLLRNILQQWLSMPCFAQFIYVGTFGHAFSLFASSFVEEEHQTWYFLSLTANLLILFDLLTLCYTNRTNRNLHETVGLLQVSNERDNIVKAKMPKTRTKINKEYNVKDSITEDRDLKVKEGVFCEKDQAITMDTSVDKMDIVRMITLLLLSRMARSWNRTGDKWAALPDVGDWLLRPDSKMVLSCVSFVSLVCIWLLLGPAFPGFSVQRYLLLPAALAGVYAFRAANGALIMPFVELDHTKGVFEARFVYTMILLLVLSIMLSKRRNGQQSSEEDEHTEYDTFVKSSNLTSDNKTNLVRKRKVTKNEQTFDMQLKHSSDSQEVRSENGAIPCGFDGAYCVWALLITLLARTHNIALVTMEIGQITCLHPIVHKFLRQESSAVITLFYLWMGQASFYHMGNSNSISTVDVSAGYIGLHDYQPVMIGLLMGLATYSGPILWMCALWKIMKSRPSSWYSVSVTCLLSRAFPVTLYVMLVTVERYHLFVWSVFSPKLLYEGMHTLLLTVLTLIVPLKQLWKRN